jgi:hypothetical protein
MDVAKYTLFVLFLFSVVVAIAALLKMGDMTPEEHERGRLELRYGYLNPDMICPHCQTKASVRTKVVNQKAGISGGKAAVGILTGGVSVLATGLSRKERVTKAHCDTCKVEWDL